MDIRKLQRAIVDGLEDVKAQDIQVFNTEHLSPLFERVIVASGTSNRQTKSLAASVRDAVRTQGFPVMRTEGEENGEWIIVDCGAAVAHIMQPAIRQYYHLEEIWGGKTVKMKFGDAKVGLVKAAEPDAPAARTPARAPARSRTAKPAGGKPTAKKTAGTTAGKSVTKPASKSASQAAGKTATKAPSKTAGSRTSAAKSATKAAPKSSPQAARSPAKSAAKSAAKPAVKAAAKKAAPAKKASSRA